MTRSKKKADQLTDKEVLRKLFPKEVRQAMKKEPKDIPVLFPKPKPRRKR